MTDYEAIRKDLYERFHDAFEKLYISELKDQIADKDEVITAQDHMIAEQQAEIERLRKMLWEVNEQCPEHVPVSLLNQIRAALEGK
jgi:uncharacterized coiled-coil protein SlyX